MTQGTSKPVDTNYKVPGLLSECLMTSSLMISDSHPSDFFDIGPEGIATETMRHERGKRR